MNVLVGRNDDPDAAVLDGGALLLVVLAGPSTFVLRNPDFVTANRHAAIEQGQRGRWVRIARRRFRLGSQVLAIRRRQSHRHHAGRVRERAATGHAHEEATFWIL